MLSPEMSFLLINLCLLKTEIIKICNVTIIKVYFTSSYLESFIVFDLISVSFPAHCLPVKLAEKDSYYFSS